MEEKTDETLVVAPPAAPEAARKQQRDARDALPYVPLSEKFLVSASFERNVSPGISLFLPRSTNDRCPVLRTRNGKRLSSSKSISRHDRTFRRIADRRGKSLDIGEKNRESAPFPRYIFHVKNDSSLIAFLHKRSYSILCVHDIQNEYVPWSVTCKL